MGGNVPLIEFCGTFWPPLATAIAGGVGGSAIIALYTVPAVHLALARRGRGGQPQQRRPEVERLATAQPARRAG
jgi:hypothetical protein